MGLFDDIRKSFLRENMIQVTIYGMKIWVRPNGLDELTLIDSIDNRTPIQCFPVAKDKYGYQKRELFFPN